jgi:5-methylcytosine-specific restriction protein A
MERNIEKEIDKLIKKNDSEIKKYYARYLISVRNNKIATVKHYFDALNNISRRLKEKNLVTTDIYEINDLNQLLQVREILYADKDFIELNTRGNNMYSVGLNNYCKFAAGEDFLKLQDKISMLDVPMEVTTIIKNEHNTWRRSGIIRTQVIEFAGYNCEINKDHKSFVAEKNKKPYMEGHHVIPMKLQSNFDKSLDVYANIICLCPICHRKIHYGLKEDRRLLMSQIYDNRSVRLEHSGIRLSKKEFVEIVT